MKHHDVRRQSPRPTTTHTLLCALALAIGLALCAASAFAASDEPGAPSPTAAALPAVARAPRTATRRHLLDVTISPLFTYDRVFHLRGGLSYSYGFNRYLALRATIAAGGAFDLASEMGVGLELKAGPTVQLPVFSWLTTGINAELGASYAYLPQGGRPTTHLVQAVFEPKAFLRFGKTTWRGSFLLQGGPRVTIDGEGRTTLGMALEVGLGVRF